jgi:hypothetical protein
MTNINMEVVSTPPSHMTREEGKHHKRMLTTSHWARAGRDDGRERMASA